MPLNRLEVAVKNLNQASDYGYEMDLNGGRAFVAALMMLSMAPVVAAAQVEPPRLPILVFPGANWKAITCSPGAPVVEIPAIHRQVFAFLNGVQRGQVDPKTVDPAMRAPGVRKFFSQLGLVHQLQFRAGNVACAKDAANYSYHIVGTKWTTDLVISIFRGKIDGYSQL